MNIHCCSTKSPIFKYRAHTHKRWEIICQLDGEARVTVDDRKYELAPRDVLLIPPNEWRRGDSEAGFCDIALRADGIAFPTPAKLHDTGGDITSLMFMLQRTLTERRSGYMAVADALVGAIMQMIHLELGTSCSPEVEHFKAVLYRHLSDCTFDLTEEIAKTGYTSDHFRRRFKGETGKTPLQYLTELRVTHAKSLLADEAHFRIEDIAEECGFSDSFYFSTCFKKHVGLSPAAYRKNLRK